ncbi:hypothetical protein [Flagellimonas sp. 2504JD4-2]
MSPSAEGAFKYIVDFGNGGATVTVGINGSTTNTYSEEGNYTVTITYIAPNGKETQEQYDIFVELTALINFESGISVSENNIAEVTFTPQADNATSFEIKFGDTENEVATTIAAGESITHLYPAFDNYTATITAIGPNDKTAEITEDINTGEIPESSCPFPISVDFENEEAFEAFGGTSYEIVDNPDLSGANPVASKVGALTNGGNQYEGFTYVFSPAADFSVDDKVVKLKFWSDVAVSIRLDMNGDNTGERSVEVSVTHSGSGWEELSFDYNNAVKTWIDGTQGFGEPLVPTGQYDKLALFIDGAGTTAGTFYIDDIGFCEDDSVSDCDAAFATPVDFESEEAFEAFGGTSYEIVDNPDLSGANSEASKVGALTNGGNQYEGFTYEFSPAADFSGNNKVVNLKFWSDVAVSIRLDMNGDNTGERSIEVSVTHSGSGWEELSFDYNNAVKTWIDGTQGFGEPLVPTGQYDKLALFIDGAGTTAGTFYIDDIGFCADASGNDSDAISNFDAPIDFENEEAFEAFGGTSYEIVDNPDLSGANSEASKVGALTNGGNQYEGFTYEFSPAADFSGDNKVVRLKLWSDVAVSIRLDMNGDNTGERSVEVSVTHSGSGWEELSFDYNNAVKTYIDGTQGFGEPMVPTGLYDKLALFIDGAGTTSGTFYIDDIN